MKAFLSLVGILLIVAGAKALVSCKNGVPDFDFDYEKVLVILLLRSTKYL